jgi:hypothetical protein
MQVGVGKFASQALLERLGPNPVGAVQAALIHYAGRLEIDPGSLPRPDAFPEVFRWPHSIAFEVDLPPGVATVLLREAERLHLPVETIVGHAVLLYLADLDAASEAAAASPRLPGDDAS